MFSPTRPTNMAHGDITAVNTTLPLTGGAGSGNITLDINNFTGDAGAGGLKGAVPAPAAGDAAAGKFLSAGGGWAAPASGGISVLAYAESQTYNNAPFGAVEIIASPQFTPAVANVFIMVDFGGAAFHDTNANSAAIQIKVNGSQVAERYLYAHADGGNRGHVMPIWARIPVTIGAATIVSIEATTNTDAVVVGDSPVGVPRYPYSITVLG